MTVIPRGGGGVPPPFDGGPDHRAPLVGRQGDLQGVPPKGSPLTTRFGVPFLTGNHLAQQSTAHHLRSMASLLFTEHRRRLKVCVSPLDSDGRQTGGITGSCDTLPCAVCGCLLRRSVRMRWGEAGSVVKLSKKNFFLKKNFYSVSN